MHVEWQGDHKMLGDDVKRDFEGELKKLGFDPSNFLVEVRREPDVEGAYNVFISDLAHPEKDTWKLPGGKGKNWIEQLSKIVRR